MKPLAPYSMGIGDRFGQQGAAQLEAFRLLAAREGVTVAPVWNKSDREHTLIGTTPQSVRDEADAAVRGAAWPAPYFVDADHITLKNVDPFIGASDFFTLDVADYIGETLSESEIYAFIGKHEALIGTHTIEGLDQPLTLTRHHLAECLRTTLFAVRQAGRLYRHIAEIKGPDDFVTEISMDETELPAHLEPQQAARPPSTQKEQTQGKWRDMQFSFSSLHRLKPQLSNAWCGKRGIRTPEPL